VNYIAKYGVPNYILNNDTSQLYLTYYGSGSIKNLLYYGGTVYSQVN
jgi:hypothetical protein